MKIKKYGYTLLMILLIVSTIFLSVKHEQKRLSEKMALQEEKASKEMAVQKEKKKVNTESAASIWQEESESEKEDETIKKTILVKDKYFKVIEIIDAEEWKYVYTIYNADGKEVRKKESYSEPRIHYIDQETIEISISAGSYINYCVYYDIIHDRFSEQYESPIAADYHRVALLPYTDGERPLIIKDMFDEGNCYQEFFLDFADAIWPVVSAEFEDEDTLLITYNSGESYHYKKKASLLYWGDSEVRTGDEEEIPVCDIVRAMDFTAKEPQLDITPEENQIYLEGYLKVLKNEIPTIGNAEVKYYKDLWQAGICNRSGLYVSVQI